MKKIVFLNKDDVVYPACELRSLHKDAFMFNYMVLRSTLGHASCDEIFSRVYSCIWNLRRLKNLGHDGYIVFKNDFCEFLSTHKPSLPDNCIRLFEVFRFED